MNTAYLRQRRYDRNRQAGAEHTDVRTTTAVNSLKCVMEQPGILFRTSKLPVGQEFPLHERDFLIVH